MIGGVLERGSTSGRAVFARVVYWREGQTEMFISQAGAAWTVLESFFTMVAFCTLISKLAKLLFQNLPNSVFDYKALLPSGYFDVALQIATIVVVDHQGVIAKVNLPCFFLSLSATLFSLVHFGVACGRGPSRSNGGYRTRQFAWFAGPEAVVRSKLSGGVVCIQKMQTAFEDLV